ncbi:hypothetical protein Cgig2_022612 [Carnegiea gigantea]|uniref:Uncharacterized protein n=1 Tax=Carnegiea gigantea TaxID=171969 RepID=A0A9Q1JV09_9CARY|nr:hypothetical protein Cgig2_022612 [Carnegiea gigantea]
MQVDCYIDVILSDGAISKAVKCKFDFCNCEVICIEVSHLHLLDQSLAFLLFVAISEFTVSIQNLRCDVGHYEDINLNILDVNETREEKENDEEEEEEVELEDEEFEDFIVSPASVEDVPTPSNTTPSTSASPSPNPSTTLILTILLPFLIHILALFHSLESKLQFLTMRNQHNLIISSAIQLESPPNLDSSIEVNTTVDGSTSSTPSEPSYNEQMKIWIDANGLTTRDRLCGFGPKADIYTNTQGPCSIQNRGKAYTNTFATLVDENKRQKIELDSQKKVLDDVQAKLTLDQAKSKKQTKKVHKYAEATQDLQAQMFQWHSLIKTMLSNFPPPKPVQDLLSESEDGGEDENDDGGGCGGADE